MTVAELIEAIVRTIPEMTPDDETVWSVLRDMANSNILNSNVEDYIASDDHVII